MKWPWQISELDPANAGRASIYDTCHLSAIPPYLGEYEKSRKDSRQGIDRYMHTMFQRIKIDKTDGRPASGQHPLSTSTPTTYW
jgi:hypothetical protein